MICVGASQIYYVSFADAHLNLRQAGNNSFLVAVIK